MSHLEDILFDDNGRVKGIAKQERDTETDVIRLMGGGEARKEKAPENLSELIQKMLDNPVTKEAEEPNELTKLIRSKMRLK